MQLVLAEVLGGPVSVEELKHKPGRRRTLRATGPGRSAIVKTYASDRAPAVAERLRALVDGPEEPVLPRVLHVDAARHLLVLTDVPGRPLAHAVESGDRGRCHRVGAVLAGWHRWWAGRAPAPLRPHSAARELALLLDRASRSDPAVGPAAAREAAPLAEPWPASTVVHRDLYEEQVLVGDQVGLIDLDDTAVGPPELDLGNLLAHLELLAHRTGLDLSASAAALLEGYAATAPVDGDLLHRCRRLTLLRLACIHREPAMLERARARCAF